MSCLFCEISRAVVIAASLSKLGDNGFKIADALNKHFKSDNYIVVWDYSLIPGKKVELVKRVVGDQMKTIHKKVIEDDRGNIERSAGTVAEEKCLPSRKGRGIFNLSKILP